MTLRLRKHLTAWLGLVAMWLIVVAPLVSQLVVAADRDNSTPSICSATQPAGDAIHAALSDPLAACGYCDLLADQMAIPTLQRSSLVAVMLVVPARVPVLTIRFTPLGAFPSGRPRAPPVFS